MKNIILFLCFTLSFSLYAAPQITQKIDYYSFSGGTVPEMQKSLRRNGIRQGAVVYHGFTNYFVKWRYDFQMKKGLCYLKNIQVDLKVVLTLPKWKKPFFPDKKVEKKWNAYIAALTLHENGHKDIAVRGANEIDYVLNHVGASPNCQTLKRKANQDAKKVLSKTNQKQREYDVLTDHGRTQGAYFR